jgi:hypothetical protein
VQATVEELLALQRKYQALAALRARRDQDAGPSPARATLRALAREFPGCLRELDTLGGAELIRRASRLAAAAQGGPREPWMAWISAYHAVMRAALAVKGRTSAPEPIDLAALAEEASRIAGVPLDPRFVDEVARPPQGRIGIVVLRALAALFDQPVEVVAAQLFPVRRPSPYRL